jgi:phosphatidylserine/phosphatidylglycerophosphate/cardiolipin synthase-like enzyme
MFVSTKRFLACVLALSFSACGGATPDSSGDGSDPGVGLGDPGDKADSVQSGLLSTKVVNAANTRIYAKLTKVPNSSLSSLLVAAAKRGVDVEIYLVQEKPANAATVLGAQHLEASGVHLIADREDRSGGYDAVVDNQLRTVKSSGSISTSSSKTKLENAVNAFHAVLDREPALTTRKMKSGSLRMRVMPDDTGSEILELIAGASSSIDLEIYQVEDPAVTQALVAAAGRGVQVRVMLEPKTVGARNYDAEAATLEAGGVQVQPTPPAFDSHGNVDHAKFMLIDGKGLAYGTGNLVCSGQGANPAEEFDNRDYWIEDSRATSVAEAQKLFDADWARQDSSGISFQNLVVTPDNADAAVLSVIDGAKTKLYVENQSLNDATILEHLVAAKKRGVDVHVLLGLQPGYGGQPPANQAAIDQLTAAKIPAAFFSRHYLHAKIVLADSEAFVGSQNFTSGGLIKNRELGGIISSSTLLKALEQTFLGDELAPTP